MAEALVFYSEFDDPAAWRDALAAHVPDLDFRIWPDIGDPAEIGYVLAWKPPQGLFDALPNLKLVINLGAGVDSLVARTDLPAAPIVRISDTEMGRMMASYVTLSVLRYHRNFPEFERAQREARWLYLHPREAREVVVGVMGLGELGRMAALELARWGFAMRGWARGEKKLEGIATYAGPDGLGPFLDGLDILVVMLPLTPETRGLIDAGFLARLTPGTRLINVARGELVDETALADALESGRVGAATLDVFREEPLPADHPFWHLDNVLVTPHLASVAIPSSAAAQVADNMARARDGRPLLNRVDPSRGY